MPDSAGRERRGSLDQWSSAVVLLGPRGECRGRPRCTGFFNSEIFFVHELAARTPSRLLGVAHAG